MDSIQYSAVLAIIGALKGFSEEKLPQNPGNNGDGI